ncbi:hypothetical protein [Fischerella sp. PCC 9605]|uniref:hypothetical protein n=1 Tax=Fischerella sp. PCC 9605 TaxID=1173024 RepID=UPI00047AA896|nr:hypothetical protein [Fischerella sp. PCC 9605]
MPEQMSERDALYQFFVQFDLPEKWWDLGLFYIESTKENEPPQYLVKLKGVEDINWGGYVDENREIRFLDFNSDWNISKGKHNYKHLPPELNQWLDSFAFDEIFLEPVNADDEEITEPESPEDIEALILSLLPKLEVKQLVNIMETVVKMIDSKIT